ncbi:glycosyltransferase [Rheinheimera sp. YQF-2]|uniref:Glycosyltransferase n=1 Tax=Rheinheimera lutimaris TaxID=2740584 RepID=A0A7Y5EH98_9GAMM|nr:glycosyltransferase family 2 protein [Rheinheimera lutimaris]NRQ42225.1 glycosyltransferase [Rheinheimera lutimaris]
MKISIITATYNSAACLPNLISSLKAQTHKDFDWVVVDGGSTDGTRDLLEESKVGLNVKFISEPDFGIYDALNKGIKLLSSDYYLVVGSDDVLSPNCIEQYSKAIKEHKEVDFVTGNVKYGNRTLTVKSASSAISGAWSFVTCHSVGLVVRRSLHEQFGYYSRYFPIAADQLFIKKAVLGGAKVKTLNFIAGEFGQDGLSSSNVLGHITETFRVQYETERFKTLQIMLFVMRLVKNKLLGRL